MELIGNQVVCDLTIKTFHLFQALVVFKRTNIQAIGRNWFFIIVLADRYACFLQIAEKCTLHKKLRASKLILLSKFLQRRKQPLYYSFKYEFPIIFYKFLNQDSYHLISFTIMKVGNPFTDGY